MKHFFTLGIFVLAGQLGFAGAYFLKLFIGKQLTLPLVLMFVAMVFVKMDGNPRPPLLRLVQAVTPTHLQFCSNA